MNIFGPIDIFQPSDTISSLAAASVSLADSGGNFTAIQVEAALAEVSTDWGKLARINTWSEIQTFTAAIQISDQEIRRALLLDYAIVHSSLTQSSSTVDLDLTTANSFSFTLTENATITISNPPATGRYGQFVVKIIQDASSGAFTVTWPSSVLWPGGSAPTITTSNGAIDEVTLRTIDAGTEWRGSFSQAFS